MEYILELYHEGECIEQRTTDSPPWPDPMVGDELYIEFENPHYAEEHGKWWTVKARKALLFGAKSGERTLQVAIEPVREGEVRWSVR